VATKRIPRKKKRSTDESPKERRTKASPHFAVVHPDAAGIDIGGHSHWVAVPPEREGETVHEFGAFTKDLHSMVDWLKSHGVRTVAMEATGVLWIPVFELLETEGFEVFLVNAAHVKNVSGRKTDLVDCQWIQKLHACGLLQRSFRPDDKVVVLRSYVRQRAELVRGQSAEILRMQKALVQMNLQLHLVVSDITGATGLSILRKVIDGERDPLVLAGLRNRGCTHSELEIAEALRGTFRAEHIFALRQALQRWEHLWRQIAEVDQIADRIAIVDRGRVVVAGALDDVRENFRRIQLVFDGDAPGPAFRAPGVERVRRKGRVLTVLSSAGAEGVIDEARALGPVSVDVVPVTLKEIFLETVKAED
jgi:transposase